MRLAIFGILGSIATIGVADAVSAPPAVEYGALGILTLVVCYLLKAQREDRKVLREDRRDFLKAQREDRVDFRESLDKLIDAILRDKNMN